MQKIPIALLAVLATFTIAVEAKGDDGVVPSGQGSPSQIVEAQDLPCSPVATSWPTSASGPSRLQAPQLSVVKTDLRPKDASLFLDGRFVGRARFFNGKKGFLYLEPGEYRLEAAAKGYRTDVFLIRARPNCRFDVKHRMIKGDGGLADGESPGGKNEPVQWIWSPVAAAVPSVQPAPSGGADESLRPDLRGAPPQLAEANVGRASIRLRVRPEESTVYLDGAFLATARQLDLAVSPLAVTVGVHRIEVLAPGYAGQVAEVTLSEGGQELIEITLVPNHN